MIVQLVIKIHILCRAVCTNGSRFKADECVWCTSAGAQSWLGSTGLDLDENGFIEVDEYMQSCNTQDVFAAGVLHLLVCVTFKVAADLYL